MDKVKGGGNSLYLSMSMWAFYNCASVLERLTPLATAYVCATKGPSYRVRPLSLFGRNQSRTRLLCSLPYLKKRCGQSYACVLPCPKLVNQINHPLIVPIPTPIGISQHMERNVCNWKKSFP